MKILLVIDQFDQGNNGTTISARRFAQALAADGNEVRLQRRKTCERQISDAGDPFSAGCGFYYQKSGHGVCETEPQRAGAGDRMGGRGAFYDALCAFPCRTADCKGNGQTGDSGVPCAAGKHYIDDSSWEK